MTVPGHHRVRLWRGVDAVAGLAPTLDLLADRTGAGATARWPAVEAWLALDRPGPPVAVTVERDGDPVAAVVVQTHRRAGVCVAAAPVDAGTRVPAFAVDLPAARAAVAALRRELRSDSRAWKLWLGQLPADDPVLLALAEGPGAARTSAGPPVPRILCAPGDDLRLHLSRNTRSTVARTRNRLAAQGRTLQLQWIRDEAAALAVLPEVVALHIARTSQAYGRARLGAPAEEALFRSMVLGHARHGRLALLTNRVDGDLAAFAACFLGGDTCWVYANLVHPRWTHVSLGTLTNAEVVRSVHDAPGMRCLDWGAGLQRHKVSGNAVVEPTRMVHVWSGRTLRAVSGLQDAVRRVARRPGRDGRSPLR